jgi:hypothetical protein
VTPAHGATVRGRSAPADHQGNGSLDRLRVGIDAAEVAEAAVEFWLVVVPKVAHRVQVLVRHRAALLVLGADGAELRL